MKFHFVSANSVFSVTTALIPTQTHNYSLQSVEQLIEVKWKIQCLGDEIFNWIFVHQPKEWKENKRQRAKKKLYAIGWEKSENFNFSLSHRLQTQMSGHSEMLQIVNQFKLKNNNLKLVQQFEKEKRWVEFRSAACWNEVKKTARIFRVAALALNFYHGASVLRTFVWTLL